MVNRTIVFAYHNVGVRGLSVLLANNIDICLVVTHKDAPGENIWFDSVEALAKLNDIPVITPDDPNEEHVIQQIKALKADWFFSFYYRHMLGNDLLSLPIKGAYNLHGSLLPKYRGRVPVNWAIIHGETESGASLHRMEIKPDAGPMVDQQAIPILPNDTALDVFKKITCAAEIVLQRSVPKLLAGVANEIPLNLNDGSYYGGRCKADGLVDWNKDAWQTHNLIRAVAPPYPGAFCIINNLQLTILGSNYRAEKAKNAGVSIYWEQGRCLLDCKNGERLQLTHIEFEQTRLDEAHFIKIFGQPRIEIKEY